MAPPIIRMGTGDRLNINFDIIGDDYDYLRYRLIHCNSDWQPSRLIETEYLDGFNEAPIEDYAFSSNTYIHYVNYNLTLPDPNLPIIASGNYLLQVFPESDPSETLLQVRFSVSEERAFVTGGVTTRTDRSVDNEYQQVFLNVDFSSLPSINPFQDLIVSVTQNNTPNSVKTTTHPLRVENGKAVFEHSPELIFKAGNEFRRFETVRTDYPGMNVDSVKFSDGIWHAFLKPDYSRSHKQYVYDKTQNGRFKIDEYNSTEPDLAADYVMVNFTLDPGEHPGGAIYLDGDFTNHRLEENYLLKYDWETGRYKVSVPLKQGSYNYRYVVLNEKTGVVSPDKIEGDKYETQNEYMVQVFLRPPGSRGDRLIGSLQIR